MNKYSLAISLALLLALSACTPTATVGPDAPIEPSPTSEVSAAPTPVATPTPTPGPSLEPSVRDYGPPTVSAVPDEPAIWGEQAIRTTYLVETSTSNLDVDIALPYVGSSAPKYQAINQFYTDLLQELKTEASGQAEMSWGYLSICCGLTFESDQYVSFWRYEEGYGGGTHGFHTTQGDTFDLDTGKRLSLPDLFSDWPAAHECILSEIFLQLKNILPEQAHSDATQSADEELDTTPFYLTEDGLIIHYNEYAIGSYADGAFDFLIPYETLEDLFIQ